MLFSLSSSLTQKLSPCPTSGSSNDVQSIARSDPLIVISVDSLFSRRCQKTCAQILGHSFGDLGLQHILNFSNLHIYSDSILNHLTNKITYSNQASGSSMASAVCTFLIQRHKVQLCLQQHLPSLHRQQHLVDHHYEQHYEIY